MPPNGDYGSKPTTYFDAARTEIESALIAPYGRVLEIGCGTGSTLSWLRSSGQASHTTGIELDPRAAGECKANADRVYCLDVERQDLPEDLGSFDLILMLDVLEHLRDPWGLLASARSLLSKGGQLVVSVPNVRHLRAIAPLLLLGRWEYQESGILDSTHLRFFTKSSALSMLRDAGWSVDLVKPSNLSKGRWLTRINGLTFGVFEEFITIQYIVSARLES